MSDLPTWCPVCQQPESPGHIVAVTDPIKRLDHFSLLEPNWDSYGAAAVDPAVVELMRRAIWAFQVPPTVVPTNSGGIQLEWHTKTLDIELAIYPDGHAEFFLDDEITGRYVELSGPFETFPAKPKEPFG